MLEQVKVEADKELAEDQKGTIMYWRGHGPGVFHLSLNLFDPPKQVD